MKSPAPLRRPVASRWATGLLMGLVYLYRYSFSFFLGRTCRFMPSCSEYALAALSLHGPLRGSWLAVRRIGRCHPWGGAGYDPPPPAGVPGPACCHHGKDRHDRAAADATAGQPGQGKAE